MDAVNIRNLKLTRDKHFTLDICHLAIGTGTITCITGPNGSGKTTLIECLAGITLPDTGEITLHNKAPADRMTVHSKVGYLPDDDVWFIAELTAHEYFSVLAKVYKKAGVGNFMAARVAKFARMLHFSSFDQPLISLSHGNRKKVQLIACLMHKPEIIIIDELRNGLDPFAIIAAEEILDAEAKRGATIIAATHDLWWAERTATHIALLVDGRVTLHTQTSNVLKKYGSLEKAFLSITKLRHEHI